MEERGGICELCFLPLVSLIEIPASPALEQPLPGDAPPGPSVYPGEESTHSERCPPKLASQRARETGVFLSPCSSAQGLYPRESFHHSLSAIHKQPPPLDPRPSSHALTSPAAPLPCAAHITTSTSTFLYFIHHLLLY